MYAVRWYFNKEEFYSYLPKESPPERVFSVTGITVDVRKPRHVHLIHLYPPQPPPSIHACTCVSFPNDMLIIIISA